jgi:hypothetical protein
VQCGYYDTILASYRVSDTPTQCGGKIVANRGYRKWECLPIGSIAQACWIPSTAVNRVGWWDIKALISMVILGCCSKQ